MTPPNLIGKLYADGDTLYVANDQFPRQLDRVVPRAELDAALGRESELRTVLAEAESYIAHPEGSDPGHHRLTSILERIRSALSEPQPEAGEEKGDDPVLHAIYDAWKQLEWGDGDPTAKAILRGQLANYPPFVASQSEALTSEEDR